MDDESIKVVYQKIKTEIDQLMENKNIDFYSMSKIIHQLVQDFDTPLKNRYP